MWECNLVCSMCLAQAQELSATKTKLAASDGEVQKLKKDNAGESMSKSSLVCVFSGSL